MAGGLVVDVRGLALEQHVGGHAVPDHRRRSVQGRTDGRGRTRRGEPLRGDREGSGAHDHLHEHPEGPQRADDEPGHVVPGDVLDGRSPAAHDAAAGRDERDLEDLLAQRTDPEAANAREARREGPADGGGRIARVQRTLLAVLGEHRRQLGARRPGAHGRGHVGRLERDDARGDPDPGRVRDRAADPDVGARADRHDGLRRRDRARDLAPGRGDGHQIHAPSGTRAISPQRLPAAGPCRGWRSRRDRTRPGCGPGGPGRRRRTRAASNRASPARCRARRTARPRRRCRRGGSRRRPRGPAPTHRRPGRRRPGAGGGCRHPRGRRSS